MAKQLPKIVNKVTKPIVNKEVETQSKPLDDSATKQVIVKGVADHVTKQGAEITP